MSNIESARSNFFPGSTVAKAKQSRIGQTLLKRNDSERKAELDKFAQSDSKVDIGSAVKDFAKIKKVADSAAPIDKSEKIARLKEQIKQGNYQIDYEALADKMLKAEY